MSIATSVPAAAGPPSDQKVQELLVGESVYPQEAGEWQVTIAPRVDEQGWTSGITAEYGFKTRGR